MKKDIRVFVRAIVPRMLYTQASKLANIWSLIRNEGTRTCYRMCTQNRESTTIKFRSLSQPFTLRRIASHVDGLIQNVLRREYDAWRHPMNPQVIIDAGAFIGDLTCHWATQYPRARIIALEPNADNFAFANQNGSLYSPNVTVVNKGLWSSPGTLHIAGEEMGSYITADGAENGATKIEVIDIPSLMQEYDLPSIDILKLDIEGAERQVLGPSAVTWLTKVKAAVVEMHGEGTEQEIVARMTQCGFDSWRYRSLVYFYRKAAE